MSVTYYGIYLSYPPQVDLRHEGLGRHLAAFLKGTSGRTDVRFILVCPSWSKKNLEDLFASEGVLKEQFEVVSPGKEPLILRFYSFYLSYKTRPRNKGFAQWLAEAKAGLYNKVVEYVEHRFVTMSSVFELLPFVILAGAGLLLAVTLSPLLLLTFPYILIKRGISFFKVSIRKFLRRGRALKISLGAPKEDAFILRLYQGMERVESERMLLLINKLSKVKAWYSPTAFWPAFNKISAPRLMCVPDVVLSDFPVGFSGEGRFVKAFGDLEEAIHAGQHFVTYSGAVKWGTLVDKYSVHASNISVIHHAPNKLDRFFDFKSSGPVDAISHHYALSLFSDALKKSVNTDYASGFSSEGCRFIFYASQFRPNKNVISLLRAYEYLLRNRYVSHKLVMTGNPNVLPEIGQFIRDNSLENDVLCLHGLTLQELAACYKLADLAVNPTLSEGGCPFTFTEALSVGTPVVMSCIPVAEEVIDDPDVQAVTFFDPYDWKKMAERIEFALDNLDELLRIQLPFYKKLDARTWKDVVNEHVAVLERISRIDHVGDEVSNDEAI